MRLRKSQGNNDKYALYAVEWRGNAMEWVEQKANQMNDDIDRMWKVEHTHTHTQKCGTFEVSWHGGGSYTKLE